MNTARIFIVFAFVLALLCGVAPKPVPAASHTETAFERVMRTKTLRCGYYLYAPYIDKDLKTGKFSGIGHDIVEEIGKLLGIKIVWAEQITLGQDAAALQAHRVDSICVTADFDPNNFTLIDFTAPYFYVRNEIYARKNDKNSNKTLSFSDLDKPGMRFSGIEGDSTLIYAQTLFPSATLKALPQITEPSQLFLELNSNKTDYIVIENAVALRAMRSMPDQFTRIEVTENLPEYGAVMALPKGDQNLKNLLDHAIDYLNINGVLGAVLNRYDPKKTAVLRVALPYTDIP